MRKYVLILVLLMTSLIAAKVYIEPNLPVQKIDISSYSPIQKKIVSGARKQIGKTLQYDPSYKRLDYPNGDVELISGVCTDVVIRALRNAGFDLQVLVHEDMKKNFELYPKNWGLKKTDTNIDHRRVPNLEKYFERKGWSLPVTKQSKNYKPGDIVTWKLGNGIDHTGVVVDTLTYLKRPLIIHNIGSGAQLEDVLFSWKIRGHFRPKL